MVGLNMKRVGNLYNDIDINYIFNIYKQVKSNTKNKYKIYKFDSFLSMNVYSIYKTFMNGNYAPKGYNIFLIKEPKYRIVMSQNIYDKVINHVIGNLLIKALDNTLINTNVATRKGKGTHYGLKCLKKYLNDLKSENVYALKFDISKYFYNINHEILKDEIRRKIKDKRFLDILFKIISSTDRGVNERIEKLKKQEISRLNNIDRINEVKRIPIYKKGYGLPIGNLTSQIMAIYYLNYLDHYIKEKLKIKYYIRYMDDGVLLCNNKNYLRYCLKEIERIVSLYDLKLNDKTKIINVNKEGLEFLGFRFYIINNKLIMKLRVSVKRNFKRKMKLIKKSKINFPISVVASYKGQLKYGNCYNLLNNILSK